jgi:peroxin-12
MINNVFESGASFAETFYGLKRSALGKSASSLSTKQKNLSLVVLVLFDYAKSKLSTLIEDWRNRNNQQPVQVNFLVICFQLKKAINLQALVLKNVSGLQVLWRSISMVNLLTYMTGKTEYHSPLLRFAGVGLHISEEEMSPRDFSHLRLVKKSIFYAFALSPLQITNLFSFWRRAIALIGPGLARCLEVGTFTLQFLRWWHGDGGPRNQLTALPVPSAPQVEF